jgi:hypothetical protein
MDGWSSVVDPGNNARPADDARSGAVTCHQKFESRTPPCCSRKHLLQHLDRSRTQDTSSSSAASRMPSSNPCAFAKASETRARRKTCPSTVRTILRIFGLAKHWSVEPHKSRE